MPSSDPPTAEPSPAEAPAPAQGKGSAAKQAKGKEPATLTDASKISPAELKKQAKAEKAARRAQALLEKQGGATAPAAIPSPSSQQKAEGQKGLKGQHKRGGSTTVEVRNLPVRGAQKAAAVPATIELKKEDKTVEFFRHLYKTRTTSIAGASKDVHPAVLALGLQMSNYTICGSCARLVATLQAFKRVSCFHLHLMIVMVIYTNFTRSSNHILHRHKIHLVDISHHMCSHHKSNICHPVDLSQYLWEMLSGG
jgi:translation initiation factor eIF-2B subunit delta